MPDNYVGVNLGSRLGGTLLSSLNGLVLHSGSLKQLKLDMDNMTDGVSFVTLESSFGIPAGKGTTIYNLVAGAVSELNAATNLNNLLNWLAATR